jgi:hypothetical protein
MKRMASGRKNSKSNGSSTRLAPRANGDRQFVVCVRNSGYKASLELRKLYQVIPDDGAAARHYVRIVDESGEDYLYPDTYFMALDLTTPVKKALLRAS